MSKNARKNLNEPCDKTLVFRITQTEYDFLSVTSRVTGLSISQIVRCLIDKCVSEIKFEKMEDNNAN